MTRPDYAWEIRAALTDPRRLCQELGLDLRDATPQAGGGITIRCPVHEERSPSCSVSRGRDHTIRVKCFGCDWSGDALGFVGAVRGIPRSEFRELLAEAATIAGLHGIADEIRSGKPAPDRPPPKPLPPPDPPKPYPPSSEIRGAWMSATPVTDDRDVSGYLVRRRIDPEVVQSRQLARVLTAPPPSWATLGRQSWIETGHRMICRVFDDGGVLRSVRASRVVDGIPKRLPPTGYKAKGLVLANRAAWAMLRGAAPGRVLIAEGEPDWMTLATVQPEEVPVLGIASGSWTDGFAGALPRHADVVIYTDPDEAGERYAKKITESIGDKCKVWRAA